jgi:hypothetical protein
LTESVDVSLLDDEDEDEDDDEVGAAREKVAHPVEGAGGGRDASANVCTAGWAAAESRNANAASNAVVDDEDEPERL